MRGRRFWPFLPGTAFLAAAVVSLGAGPAVAPGDSAAAPAAVTRAASTPAVPVLPGAAPSGSADDPVLVAGKEGQSVVPNFTGADLNPVLAGAKHWRWVAPSTGKFRLTTSGSEVDTLLTVAPHGRPAQAVSNDDDGDVRTSTVVVDATAGTSYDVTVASQSSDAGLLTLGWSAVATTAATSSPTIASPAQLGTASTVYASIPVSANTGEKPQNKAWFYDGSWWVVVPSATIQPAGSWVMRQESGGWRNVLWLTADTSVRADTVQVGDLVHVLLHGATSQVVSLQYDAGSHTYAAWSQRPTPVTVSLPGSETATLDVDGTGRMWVAYDGPSTANVLWADAPYSTFSAPIVLASAILDDDIDVVTRVPGGVSVMWSNQATQRFGFRLHQDGAAPTAWSTDEVPGAQDAKKIGHGMADDHINTAVAADGTFYASVKTSYDTKGYPVLGLLVRRPNGTWDHFYPVDYIGTRPIVLLNEQAGLLTVAYTASTNLDNILVKSTPTSAISFSGAAATLIKGKNNNVTSTRQSWTGSVPVLASNGTTTVSTMVSAPTAPSAPVVVDGSSSVVAGSSVSGTLTGTPGSGTSPMSYKVVTGPAKGTLSLTDASTGAFTYTAPAGASGTDTFTYQATQGALTSNTATWTITINPAAPTGGLVGQWNLDDGSGTTAVDSSGSSNNATISGTPTWTTGVHGGALKLNGTTDYAAAPDTASLDATTALSITAWIRPTKVATQYLVKKAANGTTNGYELGLSSTGKAFVRLNQATKADTYRVDSTTSYPTNGTTWMHLAATYDGTTIRLYVNGTLEGSTTGPTTIATNTLPLTIGAEPGGIRPFAGTLDDIRVYTTTLTPTDITALATP